MTRHAYLAAALLVTVAASPVAASPCSEQIEALSGKVREEGKDAISASSGGQADAAARGGQGKTGASGDASNTPHEKSADAGKGADKAQAAKVALDEASTADGKGDAKGCTDAIGRAKKELGEAP
ncbi:hypothetical protein [Methylobacterium haplocladii]|uniref:Uncharacterized protein n=1 Tax=Methylobacterium haplocladii TaxID=1176176 RepID=A0A512IW10_9HYPH|nr:hypothetical protein [Methylobacterium haplocladii]GEP01866.1 hypothetical protein MHA02_42530 [Methylobacterium haplocladii]GJD86401.1 hypothetical protein HPGCJGGD_4307 [Methylobacterium haplocladii]GLS61299.1 hypothetical protein GCM10007887_40020 [Methylobacterium haplocladii]